MPTIAASHGDEWLDDTVAYQAYQRLACMSNTLADYIRRLGWPARSDAFNNYVTIMPRLVALAGLGEFSRLGIVVNPFVGAAFKAAAVLTDLPSGMPDALFRADIVPLLPYIDLYVSSGTCGFRKPNPAGLRQIAAHFSAAMEALVFIGDEDKDAATASRAGCGFLRIDRSGRGSAGCLHSLDALCPTESSG